MEGDLRVRSSMSGLFWMVGVSLVVGRGWRDLLVGTGKVSMRRVGTRARARVSAMVRDMVIHVRLHGVLVVWLVMHVYPGVRVGFVCCGSCVLCVLCCVCMCVVQCRMARGTNFN